ncbi:MerR family transcriptional regulator [Piscinibacter sakaiensis]|uniref:MerR family transcriptional regulator n=1 Tax=Piscinibacter sakaiensis TaxID=1547922 RepID=UPI003AACEB7D
MNLDESNWYSIAAVERDTGLGKDTLRVWERRYGFPAPRRDAVGERCYSPEQVEKLRIIKRLLDAGHRPGHLVALEVDELHGLTAVTKSAPKKPPPADPELRAELHAIVDLLQTHQIAAVRRSLSRLQMRMGLAAFISDALVPLNTMVGDAWMRGGLEIYGEHAFSEVQQIVLRQALAGLVDPGIARPRVLLSTFPGEPHGLGLLLAEAVFAIDGAQCLSLGPQTPIWDIVLAAQAYRSDIVALGFTACLNPNLIVDGLTELRSKLPPEVAVWVGGSAPVLFRRPIAGVTALRELGAIHGSLLDWHRNRS